MKDRVHETFVGSACLWTGTRYTVTGLEADTTYSWQVRARDTVGNETDWSASASATTLSAPVVPEPPAAVSSLAVVDNTDGSATLSWNDVVDESSYEVYRETWHAKRNRWHSATLVATLGENTVEFTDSGVSGRLRYRVRSVNSVGNADSEWIEVTVVSEKGGGGCKGGPKKCGPA